MRSWALITGGSVRLGREIGLAFARAGWPVGRFEVGELNGGYVFVRVSA